MDVFSLPTTKNQEEFLTLELLKAQANVMRERMARNDSTTVSLGTFERMASRGVPGD